MIRQKHIQGLLQMELYDVIIISSNVYKTFSFCGSLIRSSQSCQINIRPVYTTSGLGTAPQKMGTVPKLLLRYLLVYTTNSNRHDFIVSTVPIGKRHLYFLLTTVQFVSGQGTPVIFHVSLQYR